jgi:hypothetical protein
MRRPDCRDEDGQVLPALLLLVVVLLAGGILLLQVGRATALRADVVTAADAAALAGAQSIRAQYVEYLMATAGADSAFVPDAERVCNAARDYAGRNDGTLVDCRPGTFDVRVRVENNRQNRLDGDAGLPTQGQGAVATARAVVEINYSFAPPGAGGSGGAPSTSGGDCTLSEAELQQAADAAGLPSVPAGSALRRYSGCGTSPGVSVAGLSPEMQASILKLEDAIGGPLELNSGYRSASYQAQLCERVSGPCAPPGRSMHQYGLAIDVANHQQVAAAVNRDRSIGLCQPLPRTDAVHFSHATGRECGGSTGTLGPAGLFGGDISSYVTFEVRLVE